MRSKRLVEERRNIERGDEQRLNLNKKIKKCIRDEKTVETREGTIGLGTIQVNQEHITNQISKKKDTHSVGEEFERRNSHFTKSSCHRLPRVLQQTVG